MRVLSVPASGFPVLAPSPHSPVVITLIVIVSLAFFLGIVGEENTRWKATATRKGEAEAENRPPPEPGRVLHRESTGAGGTSLVLAIIFLTVLLAEERSCWDHSRGNTVHEGKD